VKSSDDPAKALSGASNSWCQEIPYRGARGQGPGPGDAVKK